MVKTNCLRAVFLAACLVACASAPRDQPRSAAAAWAETVKASVGPAWTSRVKQAAAEHDPGVCLDFRRDRRTVVNFTVDHDGQVSDVHVTASSGIEYLDNLAVDVFRSAKRLNPPLARAWDRSRRLNSRSPSQWWRCIHPPVRRVQIRRRSSRATLGVLAKKGHLVRARHA